MEILRSLILRSSGRSAWRSSDLKYAELPDVTSIAPETTKQLLLAAGGLALLLSRCPPQEAMKLFPNAAKLYLLLRRELRDGGGTTASAQLMLDVLHETTERLDPVSRNALRACLEARRAHDARRSDKLESMHSVDAAA